MNDEYNNAFEQAVKENIIVIPDRVPKELQREIIWLAFDRWLSEKFGEAYNNSDTYKSYCTIENLREFCSEYYANNLDYAKPERIILTDSTLYDLDDIELLNKIFDHLYQGYRYYQDQFLRMKKIKPLSWLQGNRINPIIQKYTQPRKNGGSTDGLMLNDLGRDMMIIHGSYSNFIKYNKAVANQHRLTTMNVMLTALSVICAVITLLKGCDNRENNNKKTSTKATQIESFNSNENIPSIEQGK